MPMEKNFTRFLSYSDISVIGTDILEDAFCSDIDYRAIRELLLRVEYEPSPVIVKKLLEKI